MHYSVNSVGNRRVSSRTPTHKSIKAESQKKKHVEILIFEIII